MIILDPESSDMVLMRWKTSITQKERESGDEEIRCFRLCLWFWFSLPHIPFTITSQVCTFGIRRKRFRSHLLNENRQGGETCVMNEKDERKFWSSSSLSLHKETNQVTLLPLDRLHAYTLRASFCACVLWVRGKCVENQTFAQVDAKSSDFISCLLQRDRTRRQNKDGIQHFTAIHWIVLTFFPSFFVFELLDSSR